MNGTLEQDLFYEICRYDHSLDLESINGQGTDGQRILLPTIDLTSSDSTLLF